MAANPETVTAAAAVTALLAITAYAVLKTRTDIALTCVGDNLLRYPDLLGAWTRIWHDQAVWRIGWHARSLLPVELSWQSSRLVNGLDDPGLTCGQARSSVPSSTYSARHDRYADGTINVGGQNCLACTTSAACRTARPTSRVLAARPLARGDVTGTPETDMSFL